MRTALAAAGAVLAMLLAVSCFSDRPGTTDVTGGAGCRVDGVLPIADSMHVLVIIRDLAFHPSHVTVPAGGTVTWLNCERDEASAEPHTATSDTDVWDSGLLDVRATYSRRFEDVGDYDYHCTPHPFMAGRVAVG